MVQNWNVVLFRLPLSTQTAPPATLAVLPKNVQFVNCAFAFPLTSTAPPLWREGAVPLVKVIRRKATVPPETLKMRVELPSMVTPRPSSSRFEVMGISEEVRMVRTPWATLMTLDSPLALALATA